MPETGAPSLDESSDESVDESAEEHMLTAARHSIDEKTAELARLPRPALEQALGEIRQELTAVPADLEAFLAGLPAAGPELRAGLKQLSVSELQQFHEATLAAHTRLFPFQEAAPAPVIPAQSLELLDFGDEDDLAPLDFGGQEAGSEAPTSLRETIWLLLQLTAAWYYVHHVARSG